MSRIVIFGGTTEGRLLAEALGARNIPAVVCVATEYGERLLPGGGSVAVRTGRLDAAAMGALFARETPPLVLDATHPYATEVSGNIRAACAGHGVRRVRVLREEGGTEGCMTFRDMPALLDWLRGTEGNIFVTTGAKEAADFTALPDFRKRVYFRMLPAVEGIEKCLALGYPASRLICMQGPFSADLNAAMLRAAGAKILVTKESGRSGGFQEKLEAAKACGVTAAVLLRGAREEGVSLETAISMILERFA